MADELDSGSSVGYYVWVQVPSSALDSDKSCESRVYRYFCFEGRMAVDKRVRVIWT